MADRRMDGWVLFGGVMMILVGAMSALQGLVVMLDPEGAAELAGTGYLLSQANWGIVHLAFGVVLFLTGFGVLNGASWARVVGITVVGINMISRMFTLSGSPWWSLMVIVLDVLVIAALCIYSPPEIS